MCLQLLGWPISHAPHFVLGACSSLTHARNMIQINTNYPATNTGHMIHVPTITTDWKLQDVSEYHCKWLNIRYHHSSSPIQRYLMYAQWNLPFTDEMIPSVFSKKKDLWPEHVAKAALFGYVWGFNFCSKWEFHSSSLENPEEKTPLECLPFRFHCFKL